MSLIIIDIKERVDSVGGGGEEIVVRKVVEGGLGMFYKGKTLLYKHCSIYFGLCTHGFMFFLIPLCRILLIQICLQINQSHSLLIHSLCFHTIVVLNRVSVSQCCSDWRGRMVIATNSDFIDK